MKPTPTTHLGNKQLHKKHSVMIEGGNVPRARVMDQHIFDRYLMKGLIDMHQHRAAEHILQQAATAGMWPTGVDLSAVRVEGRQRNFVPFGAFPLGRTLVAIRKRFGDFHVYVVREVVCYDWDVSHDENLMKVLREGLDWTANRVVGYVPSVARLRKAVKKRGTEVPHAGGDEKG